jgi:hypothetical protein
MDIREEILDIAVDGVLFLETPDFDSAIIGVASRCGMEDVVAYDSEKIIKILMRYMSESEAVEYFLYNIVGSYVGEKTPVFVTLIEKKRG